MTVKNVLDYNKVIKSIIEDVDGVSSVIKFKLLVMLKQFEPIVSNFNIVRNDKILEYGTPDGNGDYTIPEPIRENFSTEEEYQHAQEVMDRFITEIDELLDSEVEIQIKKLDVEVMNSGIPTQYLLRIYDLIEGGNE